MTDAGPPRKIRRAVVEGAPATPLDAIRVAPEVAPRPLRSSPCHDCAVVTGFYGEHSDAYLEMPEEERLRRSKQWYCHNDPSLACRGHANNIGVRWDD
jgi:hypothetical protein